MAEATLMKTTSREVYHHAPSTCLRAVFIVAGVHGQSSKPREPTRERPTGTRSDVQSLTAKFHSHLARGRTGEAIQTGRKLVPLLASRPRAALADLLKTLDREVALASAHKLLAKATLLRQQGETKRLLATLKSIRNLPTPFVEFAEAEVFASAGPEFARNKAQARFEAFAGRVLDIRTLALLRIYLQEPRVDLAGLRHRAVDLSFRLAVGEEIHPPPIIVPTAWRARRAKASASRQRELARIEKKRVAIRRLERQLSSPLADSRRIGSAANRRKIERDIRKVEAAIAAARQNAAKHQATIKAAEGILASFAAAQRSQASQEPRGELVGDDEVKGDPRRAKWLAAQMLERLAHDRVRAILETPLRPDFEAALKEARSLHEDYSKRRQALESELGPLRRKEV